MKIAVRGGHNKQAIGSAYYIDEVTEDRKVKDALIKYLKSMDHGVLDVTAPECDVNTDLAFGVNKANKWGADLFISIHFNAFIPKSCAMGTEVCIFNKKTDISTRIVNNIAKLGFINRGHQIRQGLYELRKTNMPSIIVEVCFVDSKADVELYKKVGHDAVARAIAEGITNKKIEVKKADAKAIKKEATKTFIPNGEVQKKGRVISKNGVNVRDGRGTNYNVIGTLKHGEEVELYYNINGWCSMNSKFKDAKGKAVNNFVCIGTDKEKYIEIL